MAISQLIINKISNILVGDPEVNEKWNDLTHISSFSDALKSFKLLFFFIKKLVYVIETVQAEFGDELMTKEQRIEYAAEILDTLVKFTGWAGWLEAFDGIIFKFAISQVVASLDDRFGSGSWFLNQDAKKNIDSNDLYIKLIQKEFGKILPKK